MIRLGSWAFCLLVLFCRGVMGFKKECQVKIIFARFLHSPYCILWTGVTESSPNLGEEGWGLNSTSRRSIYVYYLEFCKGRFSFSTHVFIYCHSFFSVWTHVFILYFGLHNTMLFISLLRLFQFWLLSSFDMSSSFCYLNTSVFSGTRRYSRLILYFPYPRSRISSFPKEPWLFFFFFF